MTARHHLVRDTPTQDDLEQIEGFLDSQEPTRASRRAVAAAMVACSSTTQALRTIADWQRGRGDDTGADLLVELAAEFAEHEAFTVKTGE